MFEKEAEEIANKRCHEIMCFGHCSFSSPKHHRCGEWHREYNCAKEGIEFGYNKANEWHYVKDGLEDNSEWEKASDKWKSVYELTNNQLTKAKEIIKAFLDSSDLNIKHKAEEFLGEF